MNFSSTSLPGNSINNIWKMRFTKQLSFANAVEQKWQPGVLTLAVSFTNFPQNYMEYQKCPKLRSIPYTPHLNTCSTRLISMRVIFMCLMWNQNSLLKQFSWNIHVIFPCMEFNAIFQKLFLNTKGIICIPLCSAFWFCVSVCMCGYFRQSDIKHLSFLWEQSAQRLHTHHQKVPQGTVLNGQYAIQLVH